MSHATNAPTIAASAGTGADGGFPGAGVEVEVAERGCGGAGVEPGRTADVNGEAGARPEKAADGGAGAAGSGGTVAERARRVLEAGASPHGQPVWTRLLSFDRIIALAADAPAGGPLAGTLFAVKDNLDIEAEPTGAAFRPLADAPPAPHHATAVKRLIDAGAIPVGKTNLDQFATGLVGTRSPYGACHAVGHPAHVSGGSSSGSAVAVALGLVPLALGTDTAGSGRVPAAFNGIVGLKPTRGLVSTTGLLPACRSLDCVSVFARTVGEAREAFRALAALDGQDPYSRALPAHQPLVPVEPRVIAVPNTALDLDPEHDEAWQRAVHYASTIAAQVVTFDPAPFLEAAALLYQGPWIAERWNAIRGKLGAQGLEHPDLDPAVRAVLRGARRISGTDTFAGFDRLAELRRATQAVWTAADAILLPTTPGHPTHAAVAADPIGVNARLGTFTNFVNLLDLCAMAVPADRRVDGLPFGVQLIAPALHDVPLMQLAARWTGERPCIRSLPSGETLLAVAGAHLSGLALNGQLLALGARLRYRARTGPGYRLYRLPGGVIPRPGLARAGDGPQAGIAVEVWQLGHRAVGALLDTVPAPLGFGRIVLADGGDVLGFVLQGDVPADALDVTEHGGWRQYLASTGDHGH